MINNIILIVAMSVVAGILVVFALCSGSGSEPTPEPTPTSPAFSQEELIAGYVDYPYDLHLLPCSPCIDAGSNDAVTSLYDFDGNPRILDGDGDGVATVDIGPYEYVGPPYCEPEMAGGEVILMEEK